MSLYGTPSTCRHFNFSFKCHDRQLDSLLMHLIKCEFLGTLEGRIEMRESTGLIGESSTNQTYNDFLQPSPADKASLVP